MRKRLMRVEIIERQGEHEDDEREKERRREKREYS